MSESFRIVSWNCAMALHRKYQFLTDLKPDLAIIPECAEADVLRRKASGFHFTGCEWKGVNCNKGLGVFSFGSFTVRMNQSWNLSLPLFLPIEVNGPIRVNLLALWALSSGAMPKAVPNPRTTLEAINYYRSFLQAVPAIVAGDFNAGVRWDRSRGSRRFADVTQALSALGLVSAYHTALSCAFGSEKDQTFFRKLTGFHIDYVYVPSAAQPSARAVTVGSPSKWIDRSDHMPVIVDVELANGDVKGVAMAL